MTSENSSKSIDLKIIHDIKIDICYFFCDMIELGIKPRYNTINLNLNCLTSFQIYYLNLSRDLKHKLSVFQNETLSDTESKHFYEISGHFLRGIFLRDYYIYIKRLNVEQRKNIYNQINNFIIPKIDECYDIISYKKTKLKGPLKVEQIKNILFKTLEL